MYIWLMWWWLWVFDLPLITTLTSYQRIHSSRRDMGHYRRYLGNEVVKHTGKWDVLV